MDPWEHVQLFRQSQRYPDDWGAARVASAINNDDDQPFEGLSRSNIRAWVEDDGKPDAARAVDVAEQLGWFATEWTPVTRALADLVAGIYACGSIDRRGWRPGWAADSAVGRSTIESALDTVGVGSRYVAREDDSQGNEIRPREYPSILGRSLHVSGAPVGDKNADSVVGLPRWLDTAPPSVRASFAELLVRERAIAYPHKATRRLQGARAPQYFKDIRELLEDVTGETVTASETGVTISADAVRALGLG